MFCFAAVKCSCSVVTQSEHESDRQSEPLLNCHGNHNAKPDNDTEAGLQRSMVKVQSIVTAQHGNSAKYSDSSAR